MNVSVSAMDVISVADLEILKGGGKNIYFYHRCVRVLIRN